MSGRTTTWIRRRLGAIRVRQLADRLRHRLSFVPGVYVLGAIVVVHASLYFDRRLSEDDVPEILATTVESARSVFTVIAGGLITSITLLLSMMLVAVQLASSQFSPRTLRDWLGDSAVKHTVGIALGTTVFSLLALRSTRSLDEGAGETVPHATVILAVTAAVVSLFVVVRTVDHITHSLRIGSVARRIADDTISVVRSDDHLRAGQDPRRVPSVGDRHELRAVPADAAPVEATSSGWIQQIGAHEILEALPAGATGFVVVPLGAFVSAETPLMWVSPAPPDDDECRELLHDAFAVGDTRTLQQDVAFGLLQLTDIAVRALSPGVNDPSTADDVIVHLGDVLLALWAQPTADSVIRDDDRTLVRREPDHGEHLSRALEPIRRYGRTDPDVLGTLLRTVEMIRSEAVRRSLPGSLEPLDEMIASIVDSADTEGWNDRERREFDRIVDACRR